MVDIFDRFSHKRSSTLNASWNPVWISFQWDDVSPVIDHLSQKQKIEKVSLQDILYPFTDWGMTFKLYEVWIWRFFHLVLNFHTNSKFKNSKSE